MSIPSSQIDTPEDISNAATGHKANISNPNTSASSKQHSKEELERLGGEQAFYGKQGEGDIDANPGNVAGGLKAATKNPQVTEQGKADAQKKLDNM